MVWENYAEGFNKKRLIYEFLTPSIVALITIVVYLLSHLATSDILMNIKKINSEIFTVIAIQIGFNITVLALLGSFNRDTLKKVFSKITSIYEKEKVLKQLLASFIYCIFFQTGIIFIGVFYNINVEEILSIDYINPDIVTKYIVVFTFLFIWIAAIFHTFMVTIRNVILIYKFIIVTFKNSD